MAIGPLLSGFLIINLSWRWIFLISVPLTISSFILVACFAPESHNTDFALIAFSTLCFGIGWGLAWGPTTTAALTTLSHQHAGIAAGSFVTIQEIGGNLGLAITLAIVNRYDNFMSGYSVGMWALLAISIIGIILALSMKVGVENKQRIT